MIFAWPDLRRLHGRRTSLARDALAKKLRDYQDWTGVRVAVVFDGKGIAVSVSSDPGEIQIFYSREGQTADSIIERLASKYAARFKTAGRDERCSGAGNRERVRSGMHLARSAPLASRGSLAQRNFGEEGAALGGPGQDGRGRASGFAAGPLLAGGEDARKNAVKLLNRQILADVTVGSGAQGSVHPLFVVSDAGENNDRQALAHLTDERNQRDAIDFRHVEIDHDDVTLMMLEPGGGLETLREIIAGVPFCLR